MLGPPLRRFGPVCVSSQFAPLRVSLLGWQRRKKSSCATPVKKRHPQPPCHGEWVKRKPKHLTVRVFCLLRGELPKPLAARPLAAMLGEPADILHPVPNAYAIRRVASAMSKSHSSWRSPVCLPYTCGLRENPLPPTLRFCTVAGSLVGYSTVEASHCATRLLEKYSAFGLSPYQAAQVQGALVDTSLATPRKVFLVMGG